MGKYNRRRNSKKENNFVVLERDIKYGQDVPPQVAELVKAGVQQALAKFQKILVDQQYGSNLAGGSSLADMTQLTYETHYRGLSRFFKMIGDYKSLLMLRDKRPKSCLSMKVESHIMYMWYKFRPTKTVLTNLAGILVTDITGIIKHCSGSWNDPGKCKQYSGALYCIHIASKQNGHYCKMCDECHDLPVSE